MTNPVLHQVSGKVFDVCGQGQECSYKLGISLWEFSAAESFRFSNTLCLTDKIITEHKITELMCQ